MDRPLDPEAPGPFEPRDLAFLETISHLRPSLHRYCSRMTGSVADGEDVVQDALFQAYRKLDTFDDNSIVGDNEFGSKLPQVSDDAGTPFTVIVIPVDDNLAVSVRPK